MGSENRDGAGNQQERLSSQEQRRWFLAGVIEAEGSVHAAVKAHRTVPLGFFVQPAFSITQERCCRSLLEMAVEEFRCGWITPKHGNEAVLAYAIHSRPLLQERVVPFLQRYMRFLRAHGRFSRFMVILDLYEAGAHRTPDGLAQIVELAYAMNANGKQRRRPLEHVLDRILRGHTPDTPAGVKIWSDLYGDVES